MTLLSVHDDGGGDFSAWLKKLGLQDGFLESYPISKLVEWKWLVPQFRVVFPEAFFVGDVPPYSQIPEDKPVASDAVANAYSLLDQPKWFGDHETEAHWFLHPFFRPGNPSGSLLRDHQFTHGMVPKVTSIQHPGGHSTQPAMDFYFHWQGYALIDVLRNADSFDTCILNSPDATERAKRLVEKTERTRREVTGALTDPSRWGGLAKPMTWISHYRALRDSSDYFEFRHGVQPGRDKRGAVALANQLGISAEQIQQAIKDQFLVLAREWNRAAKQKCQWVSPAYESLRTDIYFAIEWLCQLTGETLDDYLDLWQYQHFGEREWAKLKTILPFEYYTDREYFLRRAPHYLNGFNERLPKIDRLEGKRLDAVVNSISRTNRHFNSFLRSFQKLHDQLNSKPIQLDGIDFRNRSPLDYYLLLAIRAETCFRAELEANGKLDENESLEAYMRKLADEIGLDAKATACFEIHRRKFTNLRAMPPNFIEAISALGRADINSS